MKLHELVTKLLDSDNFVDISLGRFLEPISRILYTATNLGMTAYVKYWFALLMAAVKLRRRVDKNFEFPELNWSF